MDTFGQGYPSNVAAGLMEREETNQGGKTTFARRIRNIFFAHRRAPVR